MLRELTFPAQMSKGTDDIANDFYLPCMRTAIDYARVSGYFSSGIYLLAWPALRGFVERRGHIRVVCSPVLATQDIDALEAGYDARDDRDLAEQINAELQVLLNDDRLRRPAQALAGLIAEGIVDVQLAYLQKSASAATKRVFHDKVGIFTDGSGDSVGFRGTMNETFLGLSADGNLESIDIFPSWIEGRDQERLRDAADRFERLWKGEMPGVDIRAIPDQTAEELRRLARERDWREVADELAAEFQAIREEAPSPEPPSPGGRPELRPHQGKALDAWAANGWRGILEHATGSGKTVIALEAVRRRLDAGEPALIVVPSEILMRQWAEEIDLQLADLNPKVLMCGGGNRDWADGTLRHWLRRPASEARIAVSIIDTAAKQSFRDQVAGGPHLLVVDEVHRAGSTEHRLLLNLNPSARLGLSATPRRYGDPSGTEALLDYFGGIVDTFTLREAIDLGFLTPYTYEPHVVQLTSDEQARWEEQTERIRRRMGRLIGKEIGEAFDDERLRLMLINRARIAKAAAGKMDLAAEVVSANLQPGDRWLIYCDSRRQLEAVRRSLSNAGVDSLAYFESMTGDQALTIREFELNGGVLVAIRCLDEGVDIPGATHALILASSTNPREFIQRRGRILRRFPGKSVSHLHDAIVIPADTHAGGTFDSMIWSELARGVEFGAGAINPQAETKLEQIARDLGLDVRMLADIGVEEEEEGSDD